MGKGRRAENRGRSEAMALNDSHQTEERSKRDWENDAAYHPYERETFCLENKFKKTEVYHSTIHGSQEPNEN